MAISPFQSRCRQNTVFCHVSIDRLAIHVEGKHGIFAAFPDRVLVVANAFHMCLRDSFYKEKKIIGASEKTPMKLQHSKRMLYKELDLLNCSCKTIKCTKRNDFRAKNYTFSTSFSQKNTQKM